MHPKHKCRRLWGSWIPSRVLLKWSPKVKLCKFTRAPKVSKELRKIESKCRVNKLWDKVLASKRCLKYLPTVKDWMFGTVARLLLKRSPNDNLWRLLGQLKPSKCWLKFWPNVNDWRFGKLTPFKLELNWLPNVKCWRPYQQSVSCDGESSKKELVLYHARKRTIFNFHNFLPLQKNTRFQNKQKTLRSLNKKITPRDSLVNQYLPNFVENDLQRSRYEAKVGAYSYFGYSDWNQCPMPRFEDGMANPHHPIFD